ncbi:MAG: transglycosylase domain-containing protein [Cyclobacteriaceae bacterium]
MLIPILFYLAILFGLSGPLPKNEALLSVKNMEATEMYDVNRLLLGKYFVVDRKQVGIEHISPYVTDALISTEDARFYEHNGIDYRSLLRVGIKTLLLGDEKSGGGSTITQQLIKNLFPRKNYRILTAPIVKTREMILARRMEKLYSKTEILLLYLNTVPFGENVFGIEAAAGRYFNKTAASLDAAEAAVLVGMLKATTNYNPRLFPERALERRNTVLTLTYKNQKISEDEWQKALKKDLVLDYSPINTNTGPAPYFRAHAINTIKEILEKVNMVEGTNYNLFTSGLKIYTTIDLEMQKIAEQSVSKQMKGLQQLFDSHWTAAKPWSANISVLQRVVRASEFYKHLQAEGKTEQEILDRMNEKMPMEVFSWTGETKKEMSLMDSVKYHLMLLHAGMVAMDPASGHIKAWVGGIDHNYFKYDHVNKRTRRQVGSTFKPILYATAFEQGILPCEYFDASQETFSEDGKDWTPMNADGTDEGHYSLQEALVKSMNTVSAKLINRTGTGSVIETARKLGIDNNIPSVPSIALGTASLSLLEMTAAYAAFANGGYSVTPTYLLKIEDKSGKVIWENPESSSTRALSYKTSRLVLELLRKVVNEGTAVRLRSTYGLSYDMAGKTGTTQNNADGWFIGITPGLVCGVWVGADNPAIHFRSTQLGQGANTALPAFAYFIQGLARAPKQRKYVSGGFAPLSEELVELLDCEPYEDPEQETLIDKIVNSRTFQIFKRNKDKKERRREKRRKARN